MTHHLNWVKAELENTMQRSEILASQANHINRLQTKQREQCHRTMDKSSKHLKDVEHEIDELEKHICLHLYCPSKTKKGKSKNFSINKSEENFIDIEDNSIYSNNQFKNLQYFNTLIENEIQNQIQTLNNLHHQIDSNSYQLTKAHFKIKHSNK